MPEYDPRRTPLNTRVAAVELADRVSNQHLVKGVSGQVTAPVVNLRRHPNGPRDRQLVLGEDLLIFEDHDGWSFVQAQKDGYVGYLPTSEVTSAPTRPTHWVCARTSHIYEDADFKSPDTLCLSFGSRITVIGTSGRFAQTPQGFIPTQHIRTIGTFLDGLVNVAKRFLGTPYLWGGNSAWGIDCSGLVQAACLANGIPCPGDSDQQEAELGTPVAPDAGYAPGDLLFWKGHVALVTSQIQLIHANVHHMAVAHEDIEHAIARISDQGDGPVTAHKRL